MNKIFIFMFVIFLISFVSADDIELFTPCGGDSELIIGCFGDEENNLFGAIPQVKAPDITGVAGGDVTIDEDVIEKDLPYLFLIILGIIILALMILINYKGKEIYLSVNQFFTLASKKLNMIKYLQEDLVKELK